MLDPIVGEHPVLRNIRTRLPALAASCDPLVIAGEPGVGKSHIAAHIHARSPFAHTPMITVDCSVLDHRDQRLRLFGGSIGFSNTSRRSPLQIQTTFVIKSPERLFTGLQEKLMQSLSTRRVAPFNAVRSYPLRSRVLLITEVRRCDRPSPVLRTLWERCKWITLPPLRKRRPDLPILARHFAEQHASKSLIGFTATRRPTSALVKVMNQHRWTNNLDELRAFIANLVIRTPAEILADSEVLHTRLFTDALQAKQPISLRMHLRQIHSLAVRRALHETQGNKTRAAQLLGLTESSLR